MVRHRHTGQHYEEAAQFRMKHKDYFSLKALYVMMHEWLLMNFYASRKNEDFPEKLYLQREHQKSGREIWFWWRTTKNPDNSSYYQYELDVDVHVILLRDVEVMHQGQKFKSNWGEVEVKIWSKVLLDYNHAWRNHWFLKNIDDLFHKRIFHHELEEKKIELYRDSYRLQEAIKTFLKMKTRLPEPELGEWYPAKGLGDAT